MKIEFVRQILVSHICLFLFPVISFNPFTFVAVREWKNKRVPIYWPSCSPDFELLDFFCGGGGLVGYIKYKCIRQCSGKSKNTESYSYR
jgi:hypothetical protein